jgi:hypothetical protein
MRYLFVEFSDDLLDDSVLHFHLLYQHCLCVFQPHYLARCDSEESFLVD